MIGLKGFKKYLIFRILSIIPTIFGVIIITFILTHVVPGNPALVVIGPEVNKHELQVLEAEMGLNKPLYVQFFIYLAQLLHGNLGYSYVLGHSVNYELGQRFPASLELAIASLLISLPTAVTLGIFSSLRANKTADHAVRFGTLGGMSMPVFWFGIVLILIFYVRLGVAPTPVGQLSNSLNPPTRITGMMILDSLLNGNFADLANSVWHIILPAFALSLVGIAVIARVVRSSMLDILNKDFMRTVFAIGLPHNVIVNKYALRNALLPAITVAAIQAGALMSGVVLTETVFSWQGLGLLSVNAIDSSNYPIIMGVVLVSGLLFVLFNFVADLLYAYIDPRISLQ